MKPLSEHYFHRGKLYILFDKQPLDDEVTWLSDETK